MNRRKFLESGAGAVAALPFVNSALFALVSPNEDVMTRRAATGTTAAEPQVFWASDPVRPNETVMIQGSDLGGVSAVVEVARLSDGPAAHAALKWVRVPVLEGSGESLKFVVPADWNPGVFAFQVKVAEMTSKPMLLNAPDPWWIQGDEGHGATPGGWLRVLGKSLAVDGRPMAPTQKESGPVAPPMFSKAVGEVGLARLTSNDGAVVTLRSTAADLYSMRFELPADLAPGRYMVQVQNGSGGNAAWRAAGMLPVAAAPKIPQTIYSVLDFYKSDPDAVKTMRDTLVKYTQPLDRTEGIRDALDKAEKNGGGIVYFPGGRYRMRGPLNVPPHTVLRGEGKDVVTLWWGSGHFNLDGGGNQGRAKVDEPAPPNPLISGTDFGIENISFYFPLDYQNGIVSQDRLRMNHVRIRIDHYWLVSGRGEGVVARLGHNFQVTNCDILSKGDGLIPGKYGLIAHNHIYTNKTSTPLGGSQQVIVEDNQFTSMDPTAYQNISGTGRNLYYARNRHDSLYVHQSDYSFTFDYGLGCYLGGIARADGTNILLSGNPSYSRRAPDQSEAWNHAAMCIVGGRGMGQWRDIVSHEGSLWKIDRPFDTAPDATSVVTIILFNGRALVIENRFEDANWVNAGYGTSIDVIFAENKLFRCADLMNYGLRHHENFQPSWHVQYLANVISEGQTGESSSGKAHDKEVYSGPLTSGMIHRRSKFMAENSGSISIGDGVLDAVVEDCTLENPLSSINVDGMAQGVVLRNNIFGGKPSPRYTGAGIKHAVVVLAPTTGSSG